MRFNKCFKGGRSPALLAIIERYGAIFARCRIFTFRILLRAASASVIPTPQFFIAATDTLVYRIDRRRIVLYRIHVENAVWDRVDRAANSISQISHNTTGHERRGVDASQLRRLTENQDRHMCQTYPGREHGQAEQRRDKPGQEDR